MNLYTFVLILKNGLHLPSDIIQDAVRHKYGHTVDVGAVMLEVMRPSRRKEVIKALKNEYHLTPKQIANLLGIKLDTVYYHQKSIR